MLGSLFDFCSIYVPLFSLGFQKLLQEVIERVGAVWGTVRASLARPRWRAVEGWTLHTRRRVGVGGGTCSGATRGER
jgi:hypothetical protein